jgi:hypothetical protein
LRDSIDITKANGGDDVNSDNSAEQAAESHSSQQLGELVQRAQGGDESALPELRAMLDVCPEIWREAGDLTLQARRTWLDLVAGSDLFVREAIERRLAEMQVALGGPQPSPLEQQLIDRILTCWLQVHYADTLLNKCQALSATDLRDLTRRQQAADHRHKMAIKQLLLLRRMLPSSANAAKIKLHDPLRAAGATKPKASAGAPENCHSPTDAEADPLLQGLAERRRALGLPDIPCTPTEADPLLLGFAEQKKAVGRPGISAAPADRNIISASSADPYIGPLLQGLLEERKKAADAAAEGKKNATDAASQSDGAIFGAADIEVG